MRPSTSGSEFDKVCCNMLQHAATYCNMLQHAATCCNTLQPAATRCSMLHYRERRLSVCQVWVTLYTPSCNTLHHTATHCNTLQHAATHCNTLQHTAAHCNTLQHTATHCNTLQHTTTHCNTMQHTATLCNTLQCKKLLSLHGFRRGCTRFQIKCLLCSILCPKDNKLPSPIVYSGTVVPTWNIVPIFWSL